MATAATIDVRLATNSIERDVAAQLARIEKRGLNININTSGSGGGFGALNKNISELEKNLEQAERRTLAFAATSASVYTVARAMKELFNSTIEVEKTLTDIGVVLGRSGQGLQSFGRNLFDIARNTAQSFGDVSKAALEFSRQGLSVEDTLKRTRDALILARQSGLDVASATDSITSALNTFNLELADSTVLVNKLANVDAAFAVSTADLVEGLKRVGSTARDAGVSLDETIGLITSLQATTARGGANIGNSLKSIFERGIRPETLAIFDKLGAATVDSEGNLISLSQILENVAQKYKSLDPAIKQVVVSQAGGVYQANALRSLLRDLSKETSIYEKATQKATASVDEAIKRNELLNTTLSSLLSRAGTTAKQVAVEIGNSAVGSGTLIGNLASNINDVLPKEGDGVVKKAGEEIGKDLLKGIGAFLGGPGAAVGLAIIAKLASRLGKYAFDAVKTFLDVGKSLSSNDQTLNSTIGKFETIRQRVQATNELLIRQNNLMLQISKGTGVQVGSLFSAAGASPSRGRSSAVGSVTPASILAGTVLGGNQPGVAGNPSLPYNAIPLRTIPPVDTSFTQKAFFANVYAQNPSIDPRLFSALNTGGGLGQATKQVSALLKSLNKSVSKDPASYSSQADQDAELKDFEARVSKIASSTGGVLGTRPGQSVFISSAVEKAKAIVGQSPTIYSNLGAQALNTFAVDERAKQRQQLIRGGLNQSLLADEIAITNARANSRAASLQRAKNIGYGAAIAAPLLAPSIDTLVQSQYFNNQSSPSSRAFSTALGAAANSISIGTLSSSLIPGTSRAKRAAVGLAAVIPGVSGAIDAVKEYKNKTPELLAAAQLTGEKLQEITSFLDTVKNIEEEINSKTSPQEIKKLLEDLGKKTNLSKFGGEFNRAGGLEGSGIKQLESIQSELQSQLIAQDALVRLQIPEKNSPIDIGRSLLEVKNASGQNFADFIKNTPGFQNDLEYASQPGAVISNKKFKQIKSTVDQFESNPLSNVFGSSNKDQLKFLFGGLAQGLNSPLGGINPKEIAETTKRFRDSLNLVISSMKKSITDADTGFTGRILEAESQTKIKKIRDSSSISFAEIQNVSPLDIVDLKRKSDISSINSQLESDISQTKKPILDASLRFGLTDLESLRKRPGAISGQAIKAIGKAQSLLPLGEKLNDPKAIDESITKIKELIATDKDFLGISTELKALEDDLEKIRTASIEAQNNEIILRKKATLAIAETNEERKEEAKLIALTQTRGGINGLYSSGFKSNQERIALLNKDAERRIYSSKFNPQTEAKNIGTDFVAAFDYNSRDFFSDLRTDAIDTAKTIKTEFGSAFKEFARGTKDAGTAFKDFALNIALNVQDKIIDLGVNSLFGSAVGGLGAIFGKKNGGRIRGYSDGGIVTGGSGLIDDVPAKLAPGDFVMTKSAVAKYGQDTFAQLNNGVDISLSNSFNYDDPRRPSAGSSASVSPFLSGFALEDDNNPQNSLRDSRINNLRSYLGERDAYELQKREAMIQFNAQKRQQLISTWISAGLAGVSGALGKGKSIGKIGNIERSVEVSGGFGYDSNVTLPKYASGGQVFGNDSARDTVPAYLTAGEFVVKGSQAARIGYGRLEAMNKGLVSKFAYGGAVGGAMSDGFSDALSKLISINEQLNQSFLEFSRNSNSAAQPLQNNSAAPSIVVNINTTLQSNGSVKTDSNSTVSNENGQFSQDNIRQFEDGIRTVTQDEILKQMRPGGLLASRQF